MLGLRSNTKELTWLVKGRELGYENVTFGGPSREVAEEAQLEESQEKSCN
jgi:hypothetical protein